MSNTLCRQVGASKRAKSRAGCLKCKERRLKCDETTPGCLQCTKKGFQCPGYKRAVKWSTKYEQHKANTNQGNRPQALDWFEREVELATAAIAQPSTPPAATVSADPPDPEQSESGHISTHLGAIQCSISVECGPVRASRQIEKDEVAPRQSIPLELDSNPDVEEQDEHLPVCEPGVDSLEDLGIVHVLPISEEDLDPTFWLDYDLSLSLYGPTDPVPIIINHYFSVICRINSCFDSPSNPLRTDILNMLTSSPLIWNCVLSMSAAHLFQNQREKSQIALGYQTEAISCMATEVTRMRKCSDGESKNRGEDLPENAFAFGSDGKKELLLGIILLGISSTWHDPSSLGLYHLKGARSVFQTWVLDNGLAVTDQPFLMNKEQSFLVSLMVYWEALCSFIVDQRTENLDYLNHFCQPNSSSKIYPSPWTGISTSIFIYIAKVGVLMRQRRIVEKLGMFNYGSVHARELYGELLDKAKVVEKEILRHHLPSADMIDDTGDIHALPHDLINVARCYRYCSLLELYRAFPELVALSRRANQDNMSTINLNRMQAERVFDLACGVLVIVQSIPKDSTTNAIQTLILLIAGSALWQCPENECRNAPDGENLHVSSIETELDELRRAEVSVDAWRGFVHDRIINLYHIVGLDPVRNVAIMLEEVWSRMDVAHEGQKDGDEGWRTWHDRSHWMDIMHEKRLETIMG